MAIMFRLEDKALLMRPLGQIGVPISTFNELDDLKRTRDRTCKFYADALQEFIEEIFQDPKCATAAVTIQMAAGIE
ncbi:hypothetical protein CF328_g7744 [Tilletia controversa]|nr:hypothetical protein CF328_g7744 [Tilletia controversa]